MAFTKVVGPGIHTLSNIASHNINSSGIITATKFVGPFDNAIIGGGTTISSDGINVTGIVTATGLDVNGNGDISGNLVIGGNLTANGDFTTLNTTLREVELLRVDANDSSLTAGIITQRGTGDILNLFDTSTEVLTVKDGGNLGVGTISPTHVIHSYGEGNLGGVRLENSHSTTTVSGNTAATAFPHNLILSNYSGLGSANDRIASIGFDVPTTGSYANATIAYQATAAGAGDLQFHLESGNVISERVRFTSSGKILTGNPVTLSHAESASLIVVSANASSGANMLSDSNAVYNHTNPSFLAVQNRYDTGNGQESGIILSQKHLEQGAWAIYGKRTGSYVSDLIFRNRTGASASAERLRIDSDGRLLIGRSSAYAHADADNLIVGNEATNEHQGITILSHTGKYGGIYFGDGDGATGSNRGKIIYDHPNDQLRIGTGGSAATQFYINSAGEVGISVSPTSGHLLHVKNAGNADSKVKIESESGYDARLILDTSNGGGAGGHIDFQIDGTLKGGIQYVSNASVSDTHDIIFRNNANTERFRITSTGITVTGEVAASQDYPNVKPIFDFNFAKVKKLDSRFRCYRTGGASYVDEFGYIKIASYNAPRFDHDPITRECKGLLIEPSRENKISYSHAYSPSGTGTVDSYTEETRSPDGEYNAKKITRSASGGNYNEGTSTTGVFSVFLKAGSTNYVQIQGGGVGMNNSTIGPYTNNTVINLSNGTFTVNQMNFTAKQYRDGWWRVSVVYTTGSSYQGTSRSIYCLDSSSPSADTVADGEHCYAWGQVFEVGSFITSYIPSGPSSQNTRGDENIRIGNTEKYNEFTDMFNAEEGTVITEHEILSSTANQGLVGFYKDFSDVDRIEVRAQAPSSNSGNARFEVVNTSSSIVSMYTSSLAHSGIGINKNNKYAFAFKTNDYAGVVNGGTPQTDTSGNVPTGLNGMIVGNSVYSVRSHLYIKRLTLYSQRLSNNQLQNLTS